MCCHLCRLEVPPEEDHDNSPMHQAAQLIAVTALDRLRTQAFADTEGTGVFVFGVPSAAAPSAGFTQPPTIASTAFSFGATNPPAQEPNSFREATDISSENGVTTNTPSKDDAETKTSSSELFGTPIAPPSFKLNFGGCTFGDCGPLIPGTTHVKYNPVVGTDEIVRSGMSQNINIKYHYITSMKEYENKSLEELRWEDYSNKGVKAGPVLGQLRDFGDFGKFSATDLEWCDYCQELVAARSHVAHQRSKAHIEAAYQDQMFKEALRGYVEKEDLKILEASSSDDLQVDPYIPGSKLDKVYNCDICEAHFVPVEFKKQHEDSIRHRACLALAAAACRRLRRHLAPGAPGHAPEAPGHAPGAPGDAPAPRLSETAMRDLLYAYRYPQNGTNNPEPAKQFRLHLPLKKYFSRISDRLDRIETADPKGSYTMIIADDAVMTNTPLMAVEMRWVVGIKAYVQGYVECCCCRGIFKRGEGHLETTEHVKYVLSPIDEQGIRKIDSSDSICLLCGDRIWTFDEGRHINEERHITNRSIALNRGKIYTESKEDLKLHLFLKGGTIQIVSEKSVDEKLTWGWGHLSDIKRV